MSLNFIAASAFEISLSFPESPKTAGELGYIYGWFASCVSRALNSTSYILFCGGFAAFSSSSSYSAGPLMMMMRRSSGFRLLYQSELFQRDYVYVYIDIYYVKELCLWDVRSV